jgi:cell division protein FtsB
VSLYSSNDINFLKKLKKEKEKKVMICITLITSILQSLCGVLLRFIKIGFLVRKITPHKLYEDGSKESDE